MIEAIVELNALGVTLANLDIDVEASMIRVDLMKGDEYIFTVEGRDEAAVGLALSDLLVEVKNGTTKYWPAL